MKKGIITLIYLVFFTISSFAGCIYTKPLTVKEVEIGNMLSWETSSENNNMKFAIQKSMDGKLFENIGEVKAMGENEEIADYRFLDIAIGVQKVFYRLMQIDYTGAFSLSHTVLMNRATENTFMISSMNSTMTDGIFTFEVKSLKAGSLNYQVLSAEKAKMLKGKFLIKKDINTVNINLKELTNGDYTILLFKNNELEHVNISKVPRDKMPKIDYVVKD